VLFEQREGEPGAISEAAEERALPNAGGGRDGVHGDVLDALLGEQLPGRAEHLLAVALRICAHPWLRVGDGDLQRHWCLIGNLCHGC
jgi:hypothetical protein